VINTTLPENAEPMNSAPERCTQPMLHCALHREYPCVAAVWAGSGLLFGRHDGG
jgi:hypothetical protein